VEPPGENRVGEPRHGGPEVPVRCPAARQRPPTGWPQATARARQPRTDTANCRRKSHPPRWPIRWNPSS